MRTPAQRRNLIKLRDKVVKFIPDGKLEMAKYFHGCGTPACVAGFACTSRKFPEMKRTSTGSVYGLEETFGVLPDEWIHIFEANLPNDPSWIAANITDLIEADA